MKTSNLILTAAFAAAALSFVVSTVRARVELPTDLAPSGQTVVDEREAFPLRHLRLDVPVMLILRSGVPAVSVEGDAAYTALIEDTDDDPAVLALALRPGASLPAGNDVTVRVATPDLARLELNGAVQARSDGPLDFPRLRVDASGNTVLELDLRGADSLTVAGEGTSNGSLRGDVGVLTLRHSGSTDLDASGLRAREATVELNGSGLVRVHADSSLHVEMRGGTEVEYSGHPRLDLEVSGSGRVRTVN